jgi:hypothetical protein
VTPCALLLVALAAQVQPGEPANGAERGTNFRLPPGPASEAWAAGAEREIKAIPAAPWREQLASARWDEPQNWTAWAAAVRRARGDAAAHFELAAAALGQGRDEDAWEHFALAPSGAEQRSERLALLTAFLPGVPSAQLGASWRDGELQLPDGVTLAPRLPPLDRSVRERLLGMGRLERREMRVDGLRLGAARFDMRVAIEQDGVQIDIENLSGGPAKLRLALPQPLDFELRGVYVDWEKLDAPALPLELDLAADGPPLSVYARFAPLMVSWPSTWPAELEPRVRQHGFVLVGAPADPLLPRLRGFAAALEPLVGVRGQWEALALGAPSAHPLATRLDFSRGADRESKWRALVGAAEAWALRRGP